MADDPTLPVAPDQPVDVRQLAVNAASERGIDPNLALSLVHRESAYNPNAVSPKGAQGAWQIKPKTAEQIAQEMGEPNLDVHKPVDNARMGAYYLSKQLDRYGGDTEKALAAYNAGPGRVDKSIAALGDDWKSGLPQETKDYIPAITRYAPMQGYTAQPSVPQNEVQPEAGGQPYVDTDNNLYTVTPGHEDEARWKGLSPVTIDEAQHIQAEKQYGSGLQQAIGAVEAPISGFSGGFSNLAEVWLGLTTPEAIRGRQLGNETQTMLGQGLGFGAGILLGGEALEALGLGTKALGLAGGAATAARAVTEAGAQAIWGGVNYATDQVLDNNEIVGSELARQAGMNGVLGLAAHFGPFALGKAIDATPLRGAIGGMGQALADAYDHSSAFLTNTPLAEVQAMRSLAPEAVARGMPMADLLQEKFGGDVNRMTKYVTEMREQGRALDGQSRESFKANVDEALGGKPILNDDGSLGPQAVAYKQMLDDQALALAKHVGTSGSGGAPSAEAKEIIGLHDARRNGLYSKYVDELLQSGGMSDNEVDSAARKLVDEQLGKSLSNTGWNEYSNSIARRISQAREALENPLNKSVADLFDASNDFRKNLDMKIDYQKFAQQAYKPGEYEAISQAAKMAGDVRDFTKNEAIFPGIAPEFRDLQAASHARLSADSAFMKLAGGEEFGEKVVREPKIAAMLTKMFNEKDPYIKKALEEFIDSHQKFADAADKITQGHGAEGIASSVKDLGEAQLSAMKNLGLKDAAQKLGASGSISARGGIMAFLAHRALGIPYGAALAPIVAFQAMTKPAGVAMVRAHLARMMGELGARIEVGSAGAVKALLGGLGRAAVRGVPAEMGREAIDPIQQAKTYIQKDVITGKKHDTWQDGAMAYRNNIASPPDLVHQLHRAFGRLQDEHQTAVAAAYGQKINFLQGKLPQSTSIGTAEEIPPAPSKLSRFAEISHAVDDPIGALEHQAASGHPDPEIIDAINQTSPSLAMRWLHSFDEHLHRQWPKDGTVPVQTQQAIAKLHGGDIGPPGLFGAHMQASYALASAPPEQEPQGPSRKQRKSDFKWGESETLPSHSSMV